MEDREILKESIEAIKEHAETQKEGIKMGLYMALEIIKGRVLDDDLINELGLNENFEKKFFEEYNKEQWAKMQVGDGKIRIDDSIETDLKDMSWLFDKYKDKN